jgi:hypothetical protein
MREQYPQAGFRTEIRAFQKDKAPIARLTRDMLSGEYDFPYLTSGVLDQKYSQDHYNEIFAKEGKPDRNATFGAIIHLAVQNARAHKDIFPPYGLLKRQNGEVAAFTRKGAFPWLDFRMSLRDTLEVFIEQQVKSMQQEAEDNPNTPHAKIYQNLEKWTMFEKINADSEVRPTTRILSGARMSATVLPQMLEEIPRKIQAADTIEKSIERYTQVAKNSTSTIGELINFDLPTFGILRRELLDRTHNIPANKFTIVDAPSKPRIDLTPAVYATTQHQIAHSNSHQTNIADTLRTKCPAGITITPEQNSALREVWEWGIEVAKDLWHQDLLQR